VPGRHRPVMSGIHRLKDVYKKVILVQ
jgi:hypothetical protein